MHQLIDRKGDGIPSDGSQDFLFLNLVSVGARIKHHVAFFTFFVQIHRILLKISSLVFSKNATDPLKRTTSRFEAL
jgi:hypothetical protein